MQRYATVFATSHGIETRCARVSCALSTMDLRTAFILGSSLGFSKYPRKRECINNTGSNAVYYNSIRRKFGSKRPCKAEYAALCRCIKSKTRVAHFSGSFSSGIYNFTGMIFNHMLCNMNAAVYLADLRLKYGCLLRSCFGLLPHG